MNIYFDVKLKVCGQHGILGTLALASVTVMQNGIEQETSLEVINLALEVKRRKEIAQVQGDTSFKLFVLTRFPPFPL